MRDKGLQHKVSMIMLLLGAALLWPVPLGGALLLVAAGIGLAIAWEADVAAGGVGQLAAEPLLAESPAPAERIA